MKTLKNLMLITMAAVLYLLPADLQAQSRQHGQGHGQARYQHHDDDVYGRRGQRHRGHGRYRRPMPPVAFCAPPPPHQLHRRMVRRAIRHHACFRGCGHRHPASCRR